jgi:glycosyltransferase involved in cell wall biosynthesis
VGRCLDSLVSQTFKDFEVLVCDDGSTDGTAAEVARYEGALQLTYHWAENFGGPARPRNAGLGLARGTYVALLDSDDWWAPDKLAQSVRRLDAGADFVYHDLYSVRSRAQRFHWHRRRSRRLAAPAFDDLLANGNAICNSSVVIRRDILLRVGGFSEDPSLIAWEDYDAWLRIAKLTERFERLDEPLGYYWAGGGNISSPRRLISNLERFEELYIRKAAGTPARSSAPPWYHYALGLAHYQLGAHPVALEHFREALGERLPTRVRLRATCATVISAAHVAVGALRRLLA